MVNISELCRHFGGISVPEIKDVLVKYGEFVGETLITENKHCSLIEETFYREIIGESVNIWKSAFSKEEVLPAGEDSVPIDTLPRIYFLINDNSVVYVGQTRSILQRIGNHTKDKQFSRVATFVVDETRIDYIEDVNILYHNPVYNKDVPTGGWLLREALKRTEYRPQEKQKSDVE
jgi:hypothetical protein